ncbi:hypothetical protein AVEN_7924-1 [Araneus ventricosus]|uniref:Mutator-like transposase domain-containing protein n=1 Tax=Araneus ventricosus TaxID=182803 RepID=A0A4Y2D1L9_ARAVE|nr:hypothetical protein AVEN_7924-1 [Araneus ventricosus]
MPRSHRIFKNRSGKNYKSSVNSVTEVENLSPNAQQTCDKERKIPNIDESFSAENTGKGVLNSIIDLTILAHCECTHEFSSTEFHEGTQTDTVNTRYVYALHSIGKGDESGRMFCGMMNLPQPPTRFQNCNKRLLDATRAVCDLTMQKAAKEAIIENNTDKNISVAVDGTWQKRGYTSHNDVITVTSMDTG